MKLKKSSNGKFVLKLSKKEWVKVANNFKTSQYRQDIDVIKDLLLSRDRSKIISALQIISDSKLAYLNVLKGRPDVTDAIALIFKSNDIEAKKLSKNILDSLNYFANEQQSNV